MNEANRTNEPSNHRKIALQQMMLKFKTQLK
jgi:hypothetical protein